MKRKNILPRSYVHAYTHVINNLTKKKKKMMTVTNVCTFDT